MAKVYRHPYPGQLIKTRNLNGAVYGLVCIGFISTGKGYRPLFQYVRK